MLTSIFTLVALSFILATLLIFADIKWRINENPLYDDVELMLPQVNCGACGYPGCRAFAEALVDKKALPGLCSVSSTQTHKDIAQRLGVDVGSQEKNVARLACAGGNNVAKHHANYIGLKNCRAASLVSGGSKNCAWGCLGLGDCAKVCQFNAIIISENHLPVVNEDKCTGCNDCVDICPKDLFSLHLQSHRLWVACKNLENGDELLNSCEVACTACGRCALDAPDNTITMQNNLPVIDYTLYQKTLEPIKRCPTGAIVWLAEDGNILKGPDAAPIVRHSDKELDCS